MRSLTPFEQQVLDGLERYSGCQGTQDGSLERSWTNGHTPAESAAMGRLAKLGLIEKRCAEGRLPAMYRHPSPPRRF